MAKREFVMLAKEYKKQDILGWLMSEKLDGLRCLWDGGVSRGIPKRLVPWANTAKDSRYKEEQIATGLWSRYGNVFHAPDWFLDKLPLTPLDGEIYCREKRQVLTSIVKTLVPTDDWHDVTYNVFDTPPALDAFGDGQINCGKNFKKFVVGGPQFWRARAAEIGATTLAPGIKFPLHILEALDLQHPVVLHPQTRVSSREQLLERVQQVLAVGGEGIILRSPISRWLPERTGNLLKLKPRSDSEARIVGYTWGDEGIEGRLLGKLGSIQLEWINPLGDLVQFDMNIGTMEERTMIGTGPRPPKERVDTANFTCPAFPLGSEITFSYRTLTLAGKPEEAQYLRAHDAY